jgi:hypothetical protein
MSLSKIERPSIPSFSATFLQKAISMNKSLFLSCRLRNFSSSLLVINVLGVVGIFSSVDKSLLKVLIRQSQAA